MQITRPMNGIRGARVQRGCVIEITAPIDSCLYMCRPAEGIGLLATQEVAMEKKFGDRQINTLSEVEGLTEVLADAELEAVSGGLRGAGDDDDLKDLEIQR
jgi:hypothetical protein